MSERGVAALAESLAADARALAAGLDVDELGDADAATVWDALTGAHRVLGAMTTLLSRRVQRNELWRTSGAPSAAEFVARTTGVGTTEARRMLETAERVKSQPEVDQAMRAGELSPTQAHLVADAAAADPKAAPELLDAAASHSLPRLKEVCGQTKFHADPDPDATYARVHRARRCRTTHESDGSWMLNANGTLDDGARIMAELDRLCDLHFRAARREGRREHLEAYRFDALVDMARRSANLEAPTLPPSSVDQGTVGADGERLPGVQVGEPAAGIDGVGSGVGCGDSAIAATKVRTNPAFLAILRIDLPALLRGSVAGDEICELAGFGPVPVRAARELLGDAIVKLIITHGQDANVTHLGRGARIAQKVAMLWRTPRCSRPGCAGTRLEYDHDDDYAHTHHTTLSELQPLCTHDHALKTRENWAFTTDDGPLDFVPPSHPRHPDRRPLRGRGRPRGSRGP